MLRIEATRLRIALSVAIRLRRKSLVKFFQSSVHLLSEIIRHFTFCANIIEDTRMTGFNEAMQFGFIFFERTFGELIKKPVCPGVDYENLSFNRQRLILTLLEDFPQA